METPYACVVIRCGLYTSEGHEVVSVVTAGYRSTPQLISIHELNCDILEVETAKMTSSLYELVRDRTTGDL